MTAAALGKSQALRQRFHDSLQAAAAAARQPEQRQGSHGALPAPASAGGPQALQQHASATSSANDRRGSTHLVALAPDFARQEAVVSIRCAVLTREQAAAGAYVAQAKRDAAARLVGAGALALCHVLGGRLARCLQTACIHRHPCR
jgi:hypothetical protein